MNYVAQWIEEVRSICGPHVPVLLVGCKTDIREKAKENGTYVPEHFVESAEVSRLRPGSKAMLTVRRANAYQPPLALNPTGNAHHSSTKA